MLRKLTMTSIHTSYSNLKRSEATGSLFIHRVWENQG